MFRNMLVFFPVLLKYPQQAYRRRIDWLFAIGYALVLGSLFVKTYRIDRIFNNKKMYMKISDLQLLVYLGIIVLVEVILLLVGENVPSLLGNQFNDSFLFGESDATILDSRQQSHHPAGCRPVIRAHGVAACMSETV